MATCILTMALRFRQPGEQDKTHPRPVIGFVQLRYYKRIDDF
jgi:hypothetical protein